MFIIFNEALEETLSMNKIIYFSLVTNKILLLITLILAIFYIQPLYSNTIKNSAVIFMYHKFGVDKYPTTSVKLEDFTNHLKVFTNKNNNVLPVSTIIDSIINNEKLPNNTIGITIDDADRSFLKVWPDIKKLGLPVTMFVSTEPVDSNNKNYLNWDEIRQLIKEGVAIGAHSHQHPKYTELSIEGDFPLAGSITGCCFSIMRI